MMNRKGKQISVYLEPLDIEKLRVMAQEDHLSSSRYVVEMIRKKYREIYGDADPAGLAKSP